MTSIGRWHLMLPSHQSTRCNETFDTIPIVIELQLSFKFIVAKFSLLSFDIIEWAKDIRRVHHKIEDDNIDFPSQDYKLSSPNVGDIQKVHKSYTTIHCAILKSRSCFFATKSTKSKKSQSRDKQQQQKQRRVLGIMRHSIKSHAWRWQQQRRSV